MNLNWRVAAENDPAAGNVGVRVTASGNGFAVQDLLSATAARQIAGALLIEADKVAPFPPPEPVADTSKKGRKGKSR